MWLTELLKSVPSLHSLVSQQLSNSFSKIYPKEITIRMNNDLITKNVPHNIITIGKT